MIEINFQKAVTLIHPKDMSTKYGDIYQQYNYGESQQAYFIVVDGGVIQLWIDSEKNEKLISILDRQDLKTYTDKVKVAKIDGKLEINLKV